MLHVERSKRWKETSHHLIEIASHYCSSLLFLFLLIHSFIISFPILPFYVMANKFFGGFIKRTQSINYMHMHSTMQSNRKPSIPYIWGFSVLQIFGISHLRESHPPCIFSLPDQLIERQRICCSKSILLRVIWPESLLSTCFGSCLGLEVHPWTKFRSNQQYHRRRSRSLSCRH